MTNNNLKITCSDSFTLSGVSYTPATIKAAVLIAPATGIKQEFYKKFASFLCEEGYGVLTFDNRGIGKSKNGSINNGNASLINWGRLDMPAALEKLKELFPNTTYHIIGHSAGGQLTGLMDNYKDITSLFNFAASSGSLSNMNYPFKLKAGFFLSFFIPINNFLFGKTNSQWVGMGEPLPKKVAKQWSKWCRGKGYVAVDFGKGITQHHYNELTMPSMWVHATDDGIANLANVKDMMRIYPNSPSQIITLNPKEQGFSSIGHMSFFSSKKQKLWKLAVDWLDKSH